jgi:hypothetical protein
MGGHVHDAWQGSAERTLMDAEVPVTLAHNHLLDGPPRPQHLHNCDEALVSPAQGGSVTFTLPDGEVVPPGTARLAVTFSWSDATVGALRFLYRPPSHGHAGHGDGSDDGHDHVDLTDAGPIADGEAVEIPLVDGMADLGHDARSHWAFLLCADPASPGVSQGDVAMRVRAFRAPVLHPDPPHPDHWRGQSSLRLASYEWSGQAWGLANQGEGDWHHLVLDNGATVPMGTSRVEIQAWLNQSGAAAGALPVKLLLYYHDAAEVDWAYRTVDATAMSEGFWSFDVSLDDDEGWDALDSPYATRSGWDLWLRVVSTVETGAPLGAGRQTAPWAGHAQLQAVVLALA